MDGPEERKDTSERDSSGKPKETSTEPKTYSEESEKKAVSDALSAAGRDAKSISDKATEAERILTDAKKTADAVTAERGQWQKERDEAEREAVHGDAEALKSLNEKIRQRNEATKLANERAELVEKETKHQATVTSDLEQIKVFNRTQLAAEVAVAKGVSIDIILKHAKDDSREAMEAVADDFKDAKSLKTDTGTTLGGVDWRELSSDEKIAKGLSQPKK